MVLWVRIVLAVGLVSGGLALFQWNSGQQGTSAYAAAATPLDVPRPVASTANARKLLSKIPVRSEFPRQGYDRELFVHWTDNDNDGCDTRREVIVTESLTPVTVGPDCFLSDGSWFSLYDGESAVGYPSHFDVDHLVALAEAWDSGASGWTAELREHFANDLDFGASLILVSASSNRAKSDKDPTAWLPRRAEARCGYVADWVRVKYRWGLSVDAKERRTIRKELKKCAPSATLTTSAAGR